MTRRRNSRKIAVLLLTVCIAAAGCSKEEQTSPPPVKPATAAVQNRATSAVNPKLKCVQKQTTSSKVALKGVQQQNSSLRRVADSEQLDFARRKDPFKPYIIESAAPVIKGGRSARKVNTLPIQSYDVNKFKLVGIIAGLKQNRALIVDPLRKGYVVKAGMQLGNNNGRITRITSDAVEVLEQFRDDDGKLRKRTVRLVLTQKSKETVR